MNEEEQLLILETCEVAMKTWLQTYASDHCDAADVACAFRRIDEHGGTIAYIADVTKAIREAKARLSR